MANLPSKLYLVQYHNGDVIGVFSNKKRLYDTIQAIDHLKMSSIYSYIAFSQMIKWNKRTTFATTQQPFQVTVIIPNEARS